MATDPAGVEAVPGEMLSLTNTVHVTCWPTATEAGEHVTTVDVARRVTVTVLLSRKLPLWCMLFLGEEALVMGDAALVGGEIVTQVAADVVSATRMQGIL